MNPPLRGGSSLLTRLDLTDEEIVKDATSELHRCETEPQFAAWSRKWGDAAMTTLSQAHAEGAF